MSKKARNLFQYTVLEQRDEECSNMISSEITVAGYLLTQLKEIGVDHLFGVPKSP